MNIFWKYLKNDIKSSRLISIATVLMITMSALLLSTAMILLGNLSGSIDSMMEHAKTPHFIQMHAGTVDRMQMEQLAKNTPMVKAWQVMEFLNIDGDEIRIDGQTLAGSVIDYGCSVQSLEFDYLTDMEGNPVYPKEGEIYLPLCLEKMAKGAKTIELYGIPFQIKGFIRDSQMNSELASSSRLLVNPKDLEKLHPLGSVEYLIEYRLENESDCSAFEQAYAKAELPANGPTITYPLCRIINALSCGILIAMIMLVCVLVTMISLLCIRFTLLAKLEDDFREIGIMKGIGMEMKVIKRLYLSKYEAAIVLGSVVGAAIAFLLQPFIVSNMYHLMGKPKQAGSQYLYILIGLIILAGCIMWYLLHLLKQLNTISPRAAMNHEPIVEKGGNGRWFRGRVLGFIGANAFLGIKDVLSKKKLYFTMGMIYLVVTFLLILPQMLYSTVSNEDFVTYMGVGKSDIQFDVQQIDDLKEKSEKMEKILQSDLAVEKYSMQYTMVFPLMSDDKSIYNLKLDVGDPSVFPLQYIDGKEAKKINEIAFSSLLAEDLNKKVGDTVVITVEGKEKKFIVSGIYQDITNGGKTAKANFPCNDMEIMRCKIGVSLYEKSNIAEKVTEYSKEFPQAKVSDVREFERQTFGVTQDLIGRAAGIAAAASFFTLFLITYLFLKMLMVKQREEIKILHFSGFSEQEIRIQYCTRILMVLIIGIVLGVIMVNVVGQAIAGILLSSLGIPKFRFIQSPVLSYLALPVSMVLVTGGTAYIGARKKLR